MTIGTNEINQARSFAKDRIKVLLLEGIHESAGLQLRAQGYTNLVESKTALQGAALACKD